MGWFSSIFGGGDSSSTNVSDVNSESKGDANVKTYSHPDGSSTRFVDYPNNSGHRDYVIVDSDSSGKETGHTTGHVSDSGITTNHHGDHKS